MATAYNLDDPWTQAKRRVGGTALADPVDKPPGGPPQQPPPLSDPGMPPLSDPGWQPPPEGAPKPPGGPPQQPPPLPDPGASPASPFDPALGQAPLSPPAAAPAASAGSPYDPHLQAIAAAPDPAAASVAQDHLGWQLHQDLTADGHAVTWKNGNLVVDGKEYAVGDGSTPPGAVPGAGAASPAASGAAFDPTSWTSGAPGPAATSAAPPGETPPEPPPAPPPAPPPPSTPAPSWLPPGAKLNPDGSVTLADGRTMPAPPPGYTRDPNTGVITKTDPNAPNATIPDFKPTAPPPGPTKKPSGGSLTDPAYVDQLIAWWGQQPGVNPSVKNDPGYWREQILSGHLGADEKYITDRFMTPEGAPAGSGGSPPGWPPSSFDPSSFDMSTGGNEAQAAGLYDWSPSAPGYTPGQIGTTVGFDNMDPELAASLKDLLAHPTALDDRTVEMMKAQSAEEAAAAAQSQDEDLRTFGNAKGIGDSPWLASARAANQWDRRASTIASNRNVDLTAAQTRMNDKRASINLVMDSVLKSASESRNRFDLNETLKQAATKLGLEKDSLVSNYIMHNIDDLTRRHGIDLGFKLDAAKLAQSSDQFKQDLMFRIMQLRQQDEQYQGSYGLDLTRLQQQADRDAWQKTKDVYLSGT